jgi:trk system potassium uptake protein TrkA
VSDVSIPVEKRVLVAGGGRVGRRLAELLGDYGHETVVVEADAERCETLRAVLGDRVVAGDARRRAVLDEADVQWCDVAAAVTGDGERNLEVCESVRAAAPAVRTVARADSPETAAREAERSFVDSVVFPERAGARLALSHVLDGDGDDLAALPPGFEVAVFTAAEGAPVVGRSPRDAALPDGSRVVGDLRRSVLVTRETPLEAGHEYLVAFDRDVADDVRDLFEG